MAIPKRPSPASLACVGLIVLFALLSWLAAAGKSPTTDEPHHAIAGWMSLRYGDFRLDPENPPLWSYWAAIPNGKGALKVDLSAEDWRLIPSWSAARWGWVRRMLWLTPGNDGDAFVARSRVMMLAFGIALAALTARWAWAVRGPIAGICAAFAFALDPSLLGHSVLVKNDLPIACFAFAICFVVWRAGQRLNGWRLFGLLVLCAAILGIKFSAPAFVGIATMLLFVRAMMPQPWPVFRWNLTGRGARLAVALSLTALIAVASFGAIWAMYGFRFSPTPDQDLLLNIHEPIERRAANSMLRVDPDHMPTTQQVQSTEPDWVVRTALFCQEHRLFPQAWLWGFLTQYAIGIYRASYLLGTHSVTGWWYYFPLAVLFKTPVATLLASVGALFVLIRRRGDQAENRAVWTILCLSAPPLTYLALSMISRVSAGQRHVFPVYPFLFIAIGIAAATAWERRNRVARGAMIGLAILLGAETIAAFPNYIAFFNFACGGTRNGPNLLADSNVDWGQDLKLLSKWQQTHSDAPLFLAYFGPVEPGFYGIRYQNMMGSESAGEVTQPRGSCYVAVSANLLHGLAAPKEVRDWYKPLRTKEPLEVLGGSIYVFDFRNTVR